MMTREIMVPLERKPIEIIVIQVDCNSAKRFSLLNDSPL